MKKAIAIISTAIFLFGTGAVPAVAQKLGAICTGELKKVEKEVANYSGESVSFNTAPSHFGKIRREPPF